MIFSLDWLRQYVDLPEDAAELARRLTSAGLTVDSFEERDDDALFDIDVTTNRPDAMNHVGVARELAVAFGRPLKLPSREVEEQEPPASTLARVQIADEKVLINGCSRYAAKIVRGVTVGSSPEWLRRRLEAIGQRPINNVVDVTNFVLWEGGQPLHAFDLATLSESRIVVRRARAGERLTTLDGEERDLVDDDLVIADAERAIALAGVMGGLDTEVTEATRDVLIESAHFDRKSVRLTAKRLGLHTDASHRFERGTDPDGCLVAAERAAALLAEVAGGAVAAGEIDEGSVELAPLIGRLDRSRLEAFAGVEIEPERIESWLTGLGFGLEAAGDGVWTVSVPSWRYFDFCDVEADSGEVFEADLFEEVMRHLGYDDIPATLPRLAGTDAGSSRPHERRELLRGVLAAAGFNEAISYAFHSAEADESVASLLGEGESLRLANPLSELYDTMQRSLLPGLIETARFNQRRGAASVRAFEIGHLFPADGPEVEAIALIAGGEPTIPWQGERPVDLYDLKGAVELVAEEFDQRLASEPADLPGFVAGTCARLLSTADGAVVGQLGQVDDGDLSFPLFTAELLTGLFDPERDPDPVAAPSKFPGIEVDLTLTHPVETSWSEIEAAVAAMAVENLDAFGLKDRYRGDGVPEGAVNTTIRFRYNSSERSLTQDEVNARQAAVTAALEDRFALARG